MLARATPEVRRSVWNRRLVRLREPFLGYAMIAPVVAVVVALSGYQLVRLIAISFTNEWVGMAPGTLQFVGLENYAIVLKFPDFPLMFRNTLVMTVTAVGLELVLGMLAALALNEGLHGRSLAAAALFLPWVLPEAAVVFLWRYILDAQNGVLNYVLVEHLHLFAEHIAFLASPLLALAAIIFVLVWRGAPFSMILFLGAIRAVPADLYEAAKVDGANAGQRWRYVTFPQIQRIVTIVAILSTIWTMEDFTTPYSLTLGGPANSTNVVAVLTYFLGTRSPQTAEAATVPALFLPIIGALVFLLFRLLRQREGEV